MKDGRNEILIDALKIKKVARKKAIRDTLLLLSGMIFILLLIGIVTEYTILETLLIVSVPLIGIGILFYILEEKMYQQEITRNMYGKIVEKCLSTEEFTQVIPIKNQFLIELMDTAKVYAILGKDDENEQVLIKVKLESENKYRDYEKVLKEEFLNNYQLTEEA